MSKQPTTEAARALVDWFVGRARLVRTVEHGMELQRRLAAIEAEARAAVLAELRAKVEGLKEPNRGFVSGARNEAFDDVLALLTEDPS